MTNTDALVDMAQEDLFRTIHELYQRHQPGIMNLAIVDGLPAILQAVLLTYQDPEPHEQVKMAIIEQLEDTVEKLAHATPIDDIEALLNSTPSDVSH